MGVASGHGNPIKQSRDGKTLPEEEVELDWGQKKKQEKFIRKAGGFRKNKKKLEFHRGAGIERGPGFLNPKSGRNRWSLTVAKNNFLFHTDFCPADSKFS